MSSLGMTGESYSVPRQRCSSPLAGHLDYVPGLVGSLVTMMSFFFFFLEGCLEVGGGGRPPRSLGLTHNSL